MNEWIEIKTYAEAWQYIKNNDCVMKSLTQSGLTNRMEVVRKGDAVIRRRASIDGMLGGRTKIFQLPDSE